MDKRQFPIYQSDRNFREAQAKIAPSLLLFAGLCLADTHLLRNERVRIAIDDNGSVTELTDLRSTPAKNLVTGRPGGFWRIVFHRGRSMENVIDPTEQSYRFTQVSDTELLVNIDKLRHEGQSLDVGVAFTIRLAEDEIRWRARIDNRDRITVAEVFFPELQGIDTLGGPETDDLVWPLGAGTRIRDLKTRLRPQVELLTEIDEPANANVNPHLELTYPFPASMAWFEFTNGRRGVYFGSHDPTFELGALRVSRLFDQGGTLRFGFVKYPFLGSGKKWESAEFVAALHPGSWHAGAAKYRTWAATWNRPPAIPAWARQMKGLYLVIMRQQYGNLMWKYSEIPALYDEARKNGMDTLALFGWTEGGHDNGYPDYKPDPEMGGEQALRDGIAEVRRRGDHVILYLNGHMMDAGSEFFRKNSERVVSKTMWGSPWYEQYNKASESSFLRYFNKRLFAAADDGTPLWRDTMSDRGLQLLSYGADGVIYDQLGAYFYPCFGPTCSSSPSMTGPQGRLKLVTDLRERLKAKCPNSGFMTEVPTDLLLPHLDFFHGWGAGYQLGTGTFPEMLRYTFPELITTSRHQAPRIDRKQANFTLAYGFRFELEVRHPSDARTVRNSDLPHLREYLGKVSALRDRYWDMLGSGTFVDEDEVSNENRALTAKAFASGARRGVVAWNNTRERQPLRLGIRGKRLVESAGVNGTLTAPPAALEPQEIVVLVFE